MAKSILITQCLQNDFVLPLQPHDELPNKLHIGYREAARLMGENPREGMLLQLMQWAYADTENLTIINIRDWHDPNDPLQKAHLEQFGNHCLQHTSGAEFVFNAVRSPGHEIVINATGMNDFVNTGLEKELDKFKNEKINVGVIGVWTEAKVSYLVYDLVTRYPNFTISVCSALTASSSTHQHYISLEQMKKLMGVTVLPSVAEFAHFLHIPVPEFKFDKNIKHEQANFIFSNGFEAKPEDEPLIHYLYRNSHKAQMDVLDGGFSGNVVMKVKSQDIHGHEEVPTVLKIGERNSIAAEKASFEKVKDVLGNNAPSIVEYLETKTRAGIKYRYASMFDEKVITFQKLYATENDFSKLTYVADVVFKKQLGRFYKAGSFEKLNLLDYYDFKEKYANGVLKRVTAITSEAEAMKEEIVMYGKSFYNVHRFYTHDLPVISQSMVVHSHYMSYLHGDLNGANIIIDAQNNVWLIDFFHTHRGHILKDLIKLENDITYIFMKINSEDEWKEATRLIDVLLDVEDLRAPLPEMKFAFAEIQKAYRMISYLRGMHENLIDSDRSSYQLWVGLLRYSVHTLSFDECNNYQKKLALYASGRLAKHIVNYKKNNSSRLRIDYLKDAQPLIGMTILPGRKDRKRSLKDDIHSISAEGIQHVVSILSQEELTHYGVPDLLNVYKEAGLNYRHVKVVDQGIPTGEEMKEVIGFMHEAVSKNQKVLVHCVGGIGRTGTAVACYLKQLHKLDTKKAIELVRTSRSPRAVESLEQEKFVESFE
ncbi:MAG TPA: isochorismatase family protein [Flavobacteriales bacterium]|nr:isochorismatase family protein [Flavobacteriales bacterium]